MAPLTSFVLYLVVTWLTFKYGELEGKWWPFALWAPGYALVYYVSLLWHPRYPCKACKGTGRHMGLLIKDSRRACTSCRGRGFFARLGARLLGISTDSPMS